MQEIYKYRNLSEEKKKQKENIKEVDTETWKRRQAKRVLKKWNINFLYSIKLSKKALKFDNVVVTKKELTLLSNQLL